MTTECPNCGCQFDPIIPPKPDADKCVWCGQYGVVELPSINKKICFCCHAEYDWKLKPQQKSILIDGLVGD